MPFPSVLSTFTRPTASNRLDNPSHSALHNTVSSALGQIEAVIGVEGPNSVVGSLEYLIKSPDSNGGGHVQTANKGGTGQTSYTKGDLLVASSTSVLTKQAIGLDGQALVANSSTATGVSWATPGGNKIVASGVYSVLANVANGSVFSTVIPGSVLGTNGVVKTKIFFNHLEADSGGNSIVFQARYGSNAVGSVLISPGTIGSVTGILEHTLFGAGNTGLQRGNIQITTVDTATRTSVVTSPNNLAFQTVTTSINSSAPQTFGFVATFNSAQPDNRVDTAGFFVDKIV